MPPTGDLACNPGMCPDWELNQWPFSSQTGTQSTDPHQPGHLWSLLKRVDSPSWCGSVDWVLDREAYWLLVFINGKDHICGQDINVDVFTLSCSPLNHQWCLLTFGSCTPYNIFSAMVFLEFLYHLKGSRKLEENRFSLFLNYTSNSRSSSGTPANIKGHCCNPCHDLCPAQTLVAYFIPT